MADEYDDPEFDRLGSSALDRVANSFPAQPVPQKINRPGFNAILVNSRQKGNPVLNGIRNVPWEYGEITADFVVGATSCALFLSLKYHRLHPEYIYNRIRDLGKQYGLRIMLVLCDIDNHSDALKELTKTCVVNGYALILAWTPAEAGRYLESFKSLESAPAKEIRGQISTNYSDQLVDVLTSIRSINKTDSYNLVGTFGSLRKAFAAQPEELTQIAGWGPQKVKNYMTAINQPFTIKNGTNREKQAAILVAATQMGQSSANGDYGPGSNHSISRITDSETLSARDASVLQGDADYAGAQDTVEVPIESVEIADGTGAEGLMNGLAEQESRDSARQRPVNAEYQGTLDILKKMREASGYNG